MNTSTLLAPIALAMGLAAAPAHAHGAIDIAVPAIVLDLNGVSVTLGAPPPPDVVVVREPERVVYRDVYPGDAYDYDHDDNQNVVVVLDRSRPTRVVYQEPARYDRRGRYQDERKCHGHGHGHWHGDRR